MTIQERLVETLSHLSPENQRRVLEFAAGLEQPVLSHPIKNPRGMLAGLGTAVTDADIADMRRDAWAKFPRDLE
jgi:hypothetical protein